MTYEWKLTMSVESGETSTGPVVLRLPSPGEIDIPRAGDRSEQAVGVRDGLMVYSHDGELLGHVAEFIIDTAGNLTSFVIRSGHTAHQELRVLMSWIHSVSRETIQLRVTVDELLAVTGSTIKPATQRRFT